MWINGSHLRAEIWTGWFAVPFQLHKCNFQCFIIRDEFMAKRNRKYQSSAVFSCPWLFVSCCDFILQTFLETLLLFWSRQYFRWIFTFSLTWETEWSTGLHFSVVALPLEEIPPRIPNSVLWPLGRLGLKDFKILLRFLLNFSVHSLSLSSSGPICMYVHTHTFIGYCFYYKFLIPWFHYF